jgi:hypothetical protein
VLEQLQGAARLPGEERQLDTPQRRRSPAGIAAGIALTAG